MQQLLFIEINRCLTCPIFFLKIFLKNFFLNFGKEKLDIGTWQSRVDNSFLAVSVNVDIMYVCQAFTDRVNLSGEPWVRNELPTRQQYHECHQFIIISDDSLMDLILLVLEVQNVYIQYRLFCLLSVHQSLFIKSQQKTSLVFVFCKHN